MMAAITPSMFSEGDTTEGRERNVGQNGEIRALQDRAVRAGIEIFNGQRTVTVDIKIPPYIWAPLKIRRTNSRRTLFRHISQNSFA